jgi:hypothetical protein
VSPSSSSNSDLRSANSFTAPNTIDLPTPSHSSGSPETASYNDCWHGGDVSRAYPVIASRPVLKRKLSPQDGPNVFEKAEAKPPTKKRPHNVIEKRYRANINEKISELRDSIPSLRVVKKAPTGDDAVGDSENEELDSTPGNKWNKASILTKAVDYIRHLEARNRRLDDENRSLKDRLQTLESVLAQGGNSDKRAAAFTSELTIEGTQDPATKADDPSEEESNKQSHPPQGLIKLPESWRKFREAQPSEHYGHIYDTPSEERGHASKWPARIMLGSLAGLMIMEGFGESDQGTASKEKGLFGIPLELLDGYHFLRSPRIYLMAFAQFCRAGGVLPLIKGFLALTIMAFFVFTYLFNSKPVPSKHDEECNIGAQGVPSLASPIEVRRRAWSTSLQTLKLPHHHFFQEWLAVTTEWLMYTVWYLFGVQANTWITGRSDEEEIARIKAWDIAIDAQLAGGDPLVSRSRVVLTSFASGTLPKTPLRLMLKSLYCRLLLFRVGYQCSVLSRAANKIATFFANREWRKAQQLHEELPPGHPDRLPVYLAALLNKDCDDVFSDAVVQRAYNLMYYRPTSEHSKDPLMDVVVEDHTIRSPLDAVAAWWSTQRLRLALTSSIQNSQDGISGVHLQSALMVAPPGSAAQTRALALHAVFHQHMRQDYYLCASNTLPGPSISSDSEYTRPYFIDSSTPVSEYPRPYFIDSTPVSEYPRPYFIDSSTPMSARPEICTVLHCAKMMMLLDRSQSIGNMNLSDEENLEPCISICTNMSSMSLFSFAAVSFVLQQCQQSDSILAAKYESNLTLSLCSWLHNREEDANVIPTDVIESLIVEITQSKYKRRLSIVSNDTGYETQEDDNPPSIFAKVDLTSRLIGIGDGDWQV